MALTCGNKQGISACRDGGVQMKYDKKYVAVVEKCPDTGLYVGYVPGFPGAHSQGKTEDLLRRHLKEVIEMLLQEVQ